MTQIIHLKHYINMYEQMNCSPYMHRLIKAHGKAYKPVPRPKHISKMKNGECFRNAHYLCVGNPELTYVEGLAMSVIPIHHAWCVDPEGNVIDPTWEKVGSEYLGIPFNLRYVEDVALESGYWGILDNMAYRDIYKEDPELFLATASGVTPSW